MGWILETNTPMNRAMEGMGGEIKRRYACTSGASRLCETCASARPPRRLHLVL